MFLRGFRRRTGRPAGELDALFRSIVDQSRTLAPRWLRSFRAIRRAELKNRRRFERQLAREAGRLRDGASTWLNDHWDARINAFIGTELFYVSRMSLLRSRGSFVLTRTGREVRMSGTVRHHWFDPYDWDRGRWVYIPRHGFVPIAVGRELVESDEARNFLMESRHVQTLEGTWLDGRWPRRGRAAFEWAVVRTDR
jgi:hypothetical protein